MWNLTRSASDSTLAPVHQQVGVSYCSECYFRSVGILAPFVLTAKEIHQDLCRIKLGWDDEIPAEYTAR